MNINELTIEQKKDLLKRLLKEEIKKYPASFAQQSMWMAHQMAPDSDAYHVTIPLRLKGKLDIVALEASINEIIRRHALLRTTFENSDNGVLQVVHPHSNWVLPIEESKGNALYREYITKPFDLEKGPLFRASMIRHSNEVHDLIIVKHHIITDSWSNGILLQEMVALYRDFVRDKPSSLKDLSIQYVDYSQWQRNVLNDSVIEKQLKYWKEQLDGDLPVLELPTDYKREISKNNQSTYCFRISSHLSNQIKEFSKKEESTIFVTMLTVFKMMLHRYTGQKDILVGTPSSQRYQEELEGLIGPFINMLVLRTNLSENLTFRELLLRVRKVVMGAYSHQDIRFEKLIEELQPNRNHSPFFQVMFQIQNAPLEEAVELEELKIESLNLHRSTSKFDMNLMFTEVEHTLQGYLDYNSDLFSEETIIRMMRHYQILLEHALENVDHPIATLPLLGEEERKQVLVDWNKTDGKASHDLFMHQIIEEQAESNPDNVALEFKNKHLTYLDLNRRANQLAHFLQNRGVGPDTLIGISMEPSLEIIVALLGILKAGGAYVPIDPSYPQSRIEYMLNDSKVSIVLTDSNHVDSLPTTQAECISLDKEWDKVSQESSEKPVCEVTGENLAYVIYTSGSTGNPKGVMVKHKGLMNYVSWATDTLRVKDGHGSILHSTLSFDLTITSLFPSLMAGKRLLILEKEQGIEGLKQALLQNKGFSLIKITPAHLQLLSKTIKPDEMNGLANVFVIGGAALSYEYIAPWLKYAPDTLIINHYGPTETVCGCCTFEVVSERIEGNIPIGKPIANTQLYVLDEHLEPSPLNVPGELYIGGQGVARGYLNRPDLTEERFIANPFSDDSSLRLYKTGDRVRRLPDGNLEFIGRMDDQIEIRGFRIEQGEIEANLCRHPLIEAAAVITLDDSSNEKSLAVYYVPSEGQEVNTKELRKHLNDFLPEYMIPSLYVPLKSLPLTLNGKIDRKKLASLELPSTSTNSTYVGPRDQYELEVVRIWEEVLERQNISIHDNFFEVGGHSLKVLDIMIAIQKQYQVTIPIHIFLGTPTIVHICNYLRNGHDETKPSCLVQLNKEVGTKRPLFLIHPGGGSVLPYYKFVKALGFEQQVYGLQSVGFESDEQPLNTISQMADRYVSEIRQAFPQGPYRIAGWSLGGYIALEITRRFESIGEQIEFLGLIDVVAPDIVVNHNPPIIRVFDRMAEILGIKESTLQAMKQEEAIEFIYMQSKNRDEFPEWWTLENFSRHMDLRIANSIARDHYRDSKEYLQPIQSNLHLFGVSEVEAVNNPHPLVDANGWNKCTDGQICHHSISGTHNTLMDDPHFYSLAEKFKQLLI
ncbi:amino acid adenylation domain-containing protein [Marininema mesophilum]|uniref:Amino acid adenylation domain-containing protein n=1 Tax=Marininema mesophilum TaxID=1048340 RepID=A0A1H2YUN7_9BACL|nr:non-ribosomal peptide synthetase [Marininema mesophilum]SDX08775.1 amino acid adenylation domain-containing protein [Marininema mesophilum]